LDAEKMRLQQGKEMAEARRK